MPLTVTITDHATSPTGYTATVSGSGGAAVTVLAAPADEPFSGISFQAVGSRVGDGTVAVNAPAGFVFVCARTATECSVPVAGRATDGQEVAAIRCQAAVAARLRLLDLPEIGPRVYEQELPDGSEVKYPCAVVHWDNAAETEESGLNGLDYVVFPVQLHFYDTAFKKTVHDRRGLRAKWRDAAGKALRHQRLAGVPESAWCDVAFGFVIDPAAEQAACYLGTLVVKAVCRLPRGLGA